MVGKKRGEERRGEEEEGFPQVTLFSIQRGDVFRRVLAIICDPSWASFVSNWLINYGSKTKE